MKPQDLLPDHIDATQAFMANLAIIEQPGDYETYQEAVNDLIDLVPVMEAFGLFKHFWLRSERAVAVITDIYPHLYGKIG
jgi:hypothetical protein